MKDKGNMPKKRKRHLRNYLLDRHFQLKYAAYLALVAATLSAVLGLLLWQAGQSLVAQSIQTVEHGKRVVAVGKQVLSESRKVSAVVEMNIVKDSFYADNPELLATFKTDAAKQNARLEGQQAALATHARLLHTQAQQIAIEQRKTMLTLFIGLGLFVLVVGLFGIVVTHKIAGPIFKMTRQIERLGKGDWALPEPLRKGDELEYFFRALETTVKQLRERREDELARVDEAIAKHDDTDDLEGLRSDMAAVL